MVEYDSGHNPAWVLWIMSRLRFWVILGSRIFYGVDLSFELFRVALVFVEFAFPEFRVRDSAF